MAVENLITEHIDIWTSAVKTKSTSGRGSSKKQELYGVKKLRELILELAVRGKLVPQDPNDEPASALYSQLASNRDSWLKDHTNDNVEAKTMLRKLKKLTEPALPFPIPNSWICVHLIQLSKMLVDCHNKTAPYTETGIPIIRTTNIRDRQFVDRDLKYVTQETYDYWSRRCPPEAGDIIFTREAPMGEATIIPSRVKWCLGQRTMLVRPMHEYVLNSYLLIALTEPHLLERASEHAVGLTVKHLRVGDVENLSVPLPPIKEQHRIVAKVDELMALCDQLEQQTESSIEAHQVLVTTLLDTLTNSADADELMQNWARISEHFDTLFTTEESIDQLKQTILQLAVMGKLVPQDPSDEPAAELLKRIAEEKAQLVKEKKIKKQKALPPIAEDEKPFELPNSWKWCRLDDICFGITSGSTPPKVNFNESEGIPYLKVYNIREQKIDFEYKPQFVDNDCHKTKLARSVLYPGDVVMNIVGPPLGKIAIIPDTYPEWNCNQAITFFRPIVPQLNKFIYTYLTAGSFLNSIELIGTAGQDNISVTKSRSILLPTPPLKEQRRIVNKVHELFLLCNSLKMRLRERHELKLCITDTIVERAV
ncbi:TPA: restriction endonuclease subunit S [Vibrio parahaemolyticus]|nr:restriction endonuclease subunit S [Vibrio parahaemolyticus]